MWVGLGIYASIYFVSSSILIQSALWRDLSGAEKNP